MSFRGFATWLLPFVVLPACREDAHDPPPSAECEAKRVTECPSPAPTYADVKPIFGERCSNATCHNPEVGGEWPLDTYSHVADWQDVVRDELLTCDMPPPGSGVVLPADERQLILQWIRCGSPE